MPLKFYVGFNQLKAKEFGLQNVNQAHVFDLLFSASAWASPVTLAGELFYWVDRRKICDELEFFDLKPDTVFRHLKGLASLGLIDYQKSGRRDCVRITERGREYQFEPADKLEGDGERGLNSEIDPSFNDFEPGERDCLGLDSEKPLDSVSCEVHSSGFLTPVDNSQNSEINPSKLGNKSESNSEIFPTDQNTNTYPSTKYQNIRTRAVELLKYLSARALQDFDISHPDSRYLVERLTEGADDELIRKLIQFKSIEWEDGYRSNLNPKTLFRLHNFGRYCEQALAFFNEDQQYSMRSGACSN